MNLHLTSHSDQYSFDFKNDCAILRWRVHLDLSQYKYICLKDFRSRPGHLIDAKRFSFISSNLVKSDVFNPLAVVHCTTSYNHAISSQGSFSLTPSNLISCSDWFILDRSVADEISFCVSNSSINSKSEIKISLVFSNEISTPTLHPICSESSR